MPKEEKVELEGEVVELDAEHRVRQGLDDLALEFDLVLLCHFRVSPIWAPRSGVHPSIWTLLRIKLPA